MTWPSSRDMATANEAHLVTIRSAAEQSWIQATFNAYQNGWFWIGFNDIQVEGQWVWDSGEPVTYTNWRSGEPDGGLAQAHGMLYSDYLWVDHHYGGPTRPIIERATAPTRGWSWPSFVATGATPEHASVADLDGDGDLDLAVPNRGSQTVTIHRNNGGGAFTTAQTISGVGSVWTLLARDLDGDGDMDLVGADSNGSVFACYYNAGSFGGRVTLASVSNAHGLAAADFNGDGRLDLVVSSLSPDSRVRILLQQPNGTFSIAQTYGPHPSEAYQPTLASLDGDQHLDLVIAHGGSGVSILRGLGGGAFAAPASLVSSHARRIAVGDIDGDGDMDLVVPMHDLHALQVWKNQGSMIFTLFSTTPCGTNPTWASLADLDADGDLDVVVAASGASAVHVLRNDGSGTMSADFVLTDQSSARWVECADVNADGRPDILCTNRDSSRFSVHRNTGTPSSAPLITWSSSMPSAGPSARHSAATASRPGEFLLFGGFSTAPQNDTWRFDGMSWEKLYPWANPAVRYDHALAHDGARSETLLFGGRSMVYAAMPDTWTWDGFDWMRRYPLVSPPARHGHRMAFDAARGVVVLFGGRDATIVFGDTWVWNGSAWAQQSPSNSPPARAEHGLTYDAQRQRVVLFGGAGLAGTFLGDVWEWNGATWEQRIGLVGGPGASADHAMTYDPIQRRVLVHGGRGSQGVIGRTFAYDGNGWVELYGPNGAPAARDGHQLVVVGGQPRVHLLGGAASSPLYAEQWHASLPSFARFDAFGAGCLGSGGVPSLVSVASPRLGQNFTIGVSNVPQNFVLGFGTFGYSNTQWGVFPLPADLWFLGMPGCRLLVDPVIIESFPAQQPMPLWSYAIPSNINLLGLRFYAQAMLLDPLVPNPQNTMQAVMTNALEGVIGY
jgi:hypothetical protein